MDKKALLEQFEVFARWYALPLDKSEDGIYRALETQSAWMSFQHQQAKVEEANAKAQMCRDEKNHAINRWSAVCKERDELQKRLDRALKETQYALQYVEDDMRGNHEFLKMAMIRVFKDLEQALKGEGND
nr:hypothetical protein [Acinetobacter baumannii]